MKADYLWSKEPDVAEWLDESRLNIARGLRQRTTDPRVKQAFMRYGTNVRPALANLDRLSTPGAVR